MGRPTSFTKERAEEILKLAREGHWTTVIAEHAGIGRSTLWDWVHRGEQTGEEPYATFAHQFREACAKAQVNCIRRIRRYARSGKEWKAEAWIAERRWPKQWAGRSEEHREKDEPEAKKQPMAADKAREVARGARLRSVKGGA